MWASTHRRFNQDSYLSFCMNISSKWIKVLNVKLESLKLLEARIGKKYYMSIGEDV